MSAPSSRRSVVRGIGAALTGTIFGVTPARPNGPDLTGAAEGFIDDCRKAGISFVVSPSGDVWYSLPITGTKEQFATRNRLTAKLDEHPRLKAAVRKVARLQITRGT
ncbi:hypothetical protein [Methylobacterium sp. WL120]|uniref:hypothetical protein n=1 Tax=Methylobacterium sp. WL120 TaxID=2603887 RepID=UPI0011C993E8|nr:hypothetical protein [Methylobacterium sp. WL120]TXM65795.1 hypothetical protein FV229_14545 [Methylobacterium sp. WL120]